MDTEKTVVVGGNVEGNITSCKIENQVIKVDKKSIWSIQQTTTYASYDVCSRKIISQYKIPEMNDIGILMAIIAGTIIILSLWTVIGVIKISQR